MNTASDEKVFLSDEGIFVSDRRFVANGTTYAMRNIASVRATSTPPKRLAGIFVVLFGLVLLAQNPFAGIPIMAIGAYFIYRQKAVYHVMLRDSSGETNALQSNDKQRITDIVGALNQAIGNSQ